VVNDADGIVSADTQTSILLSGGTHNTDYACINRITTSDGETLEQTGLLRVRNS
jgi:RNA 3'-terminal phosphate cyclase